MSLHRLLRAALLCLLPIASAPVLAASASPPGHKAVLDTVNRTFAAMARHDAAGMRALLLPGAVFALRGPDGRIKLEHDEDFLQVLASRGGDWRERIWSPRVLMHDGIAQVWAPYDFHLDGKLSHCGIDSFSLLQDEGGQWRIAAITYSMQTTGCATAPAARAGAAPAAAKH
ncbi:nuclear transport factor 2 family protein [Dyella sp.]|uniref:nuclear transport factor 2 family protein n=1 Tax=Dyella sp. TaxID=1869338 RepID=UPI002D78D239|nr:nuclear transport factor 2 family protein [Dyella sp.]HET6432719.1 nuclear transport factor 2 family protein [Dyella sp.]